MRGLVLRVVTTLCILFIFFFSSRRRHTRCSRDWSSDVCSSDLNWFSLCEIGDFHPYCSQATVFGRCWVRHCGYAVQLRKQGDSKILSIHRELHFIRERREETRMPLQNLVNAQPGRSVLAATMLSDSEPVHCFGRVGISLDGRLEKGLGICESTLHQRKAALSNVMGSRLRLRFESSNKISSICLVTEIDRCKRTTLQRMLDF